MSYSPVRVPSPTPRSSLRQRPSSSFNPTLATVYIPSSARSTSVRPSDPPLPPPRWRTKEFYCYYVVFVLVVPRMVVLGAKVSRASNPLYLRYQHKLSPGWLFGWRADMTDPQYHLFRSHLPLLVLLALLHLSLSHSFRRLFSGSKLARARFSATFSIFLLVGLHGTSALKIGLILAGNWAIVHGATRAAERREKTGEGVWRRGWTPFAIWAFNLAVLFGNELAGGYRFGAVSERLAFLDNYPGLLPRWHISWNISMLRLVSWGMECHWASSAAAIQAGRTGGEGEPLVELPTSPMQKAARSPPSQVPLTLPLPSPATLPLSASQPSTLSDFFSPSLYLAYVLYPPLYLAGPIMSFPSFSSQLSPSSSLSSSTSRPLPSPSSESPSPPPPSPSPQDELSPPSLISYTTRFLACLLTMELLLHTMYPVAIKDSGEGWWEGMSAAEVAMVGFWNLIVVWLKLLLPWRFFRLWALLDGLNPPENMVRCMANNYSTLGFWRSWHRSYNLWVIRYLYIPLGGSSRPLLATLGVFTFVALWHDLRLRLLIWGWAITAFVMPEMVARKAVPGSKFSSRPWFRPLAALGGVLNILLMMTANLVGFVVGIDGAKSLWGKMVGGWEGRSFLLVACACLFVAVQVMFEYREEEWRRGINRKC
ncbi:hypothetical protein JCM8547_005765 [Rhodosporidiobolus lusitaniae]